MNQEAKATIEFDNVKGTVKFSLDLKGVTEIDHELLLATIGSGRSVSISPAHKGDDLFAEFTIFDTSIWPKAARALENRKRKADGKPTVEEEEAQNALRVAQLQKADADAKAAKEKADADAEAIKAAADKRISDAVTAGVVAGLAKAAAKVEN